MAYWSEEDMKQFLKKRLCAACKAKGVDRLEDTCDRCKIKRRRGRPMGSKDKKQRVRRSLTMSGRALSEAPGAGAYGPVNPHFPLAMVMPGGGAGKP